MQCRLVISHPRFGTNFRSHLQGPCSFWSVWLLKMWPIGCPETSVRKYQFMLRKNRGRAKIFTLQQKPDITGHRFWVDKANREESFARMWPYGILQRWFRHRNFLGNRTLTLWLPFGYTDFQKRANFVRIFNYIFYRCTVQSDIHTVHSPTHAYLFNL